MDDLDKRNSKIIKAKNNKRKYAIKALKLEVTPSALSGQAAALRIKEDVGKQSSPTLIRTCERRGDYYTKYVHIENMLVV